MINGSLIHFENPLFAAEDGLVALGGELSTTNLIRAYRLGIFPWPINERLIPWVSPDPRTVLNFNELHVPRRLQRFQRQCTWTFTIDRAFDQVIRNCATVKRNHESGTWIIPAIIASYSQLHREGHAHSVEVWDEDELIGGLYGVDAGGSFGGESMFALKSNASKLAILHLVQHLRSRGLEWMDIQVMTPHMESLGAREISRAEFLERLAHEQEQVRKLFPEI
jgi:leucyl/phenylalanyl-tRNA---protein transferase